MSSLVDSGRSFAVTAWQRFTANRWTVAFIAALVVQAIAQALIQMEAYKSNSFGVSILKGLESSVDVPETQLQDSRATAAPASVAAASESIEGDEEESEEDDEEEEEEDDESESESSSSSESSDDEDSDSSDEEDEEEDEEDASSSAAFSLPSFSAKTSAAVQAGTITPTGISPVNSPPNSPSALPRLKNALATRDPESQLSSFQSPPPPQFPLQRAATTTLSRRPAQARVQPAFVSDLYEDSGSDESSGSDSDLEDVPESESDAEERGHRLSVRSHRLTRLRRGLIARHLVLRSLALSERSARAVVPSTLASSAPARSVVNAAPDFNKPGIAALPSGMGAPVPMNADPMTQVKPVEPQESILSSQSVTQATALPTQLAQLNKRADFPVDGVTTSRSENGTVQIFGLAEDSTRPLVVTTECASSLTAPIAMLERQGTQATTLAFFDLWLLLLALFGLYKQSVPHLPAVWISKLAAVIFNVVQTVKIQQFHDKFHSDVVQGSCGDSSILPGYWEEVLHFSIAALVLQVVFFALFTGFLWILFRFVQWQSFRTIGADRRLAKRNTIHLVHSIIVFTGAFFVMAFFSLLLNELVDPNRPTAWKNSIEDEGVSGPFVGVLGTVTALTPFWFVLSYFAASRRNVPMLAVFSLGALGLLGTAVFFLTSAPTSTNTLSTSWPFFVFISSFALVSFVATCAATVTFFFYETRFHNANGRSPPPAKGFAWATDSPVARRPTIDKHSIDEPEEPAPYEPFKEERDEEAPRYQSQYFPSGTGAQNLEQGLDLQMAAPTTDRLSRFYSQANMPFEASHSTYRGAGGDFADRPEKAQPVGYSRKSIMELVESQSPDVGSEGLVSKESPPSSQDQPSRFSVTSNATTARTRTTAASGFTSDTQVLEIPEGYKASHVPVLQQPKMKKPGAPGGQSTIRATPVSRWSATAASSTDGRASWSTAR